MDRSGKLGVLFLCLLGMPFAGFGLFAIAMAVHQFSEPRGNTPWWFPLIFGVIFSSIGFGLMAAALFGSRRYARQMRLEAEHPAEPWLLRDDWAQARVKSKTRGTMIGAWVFAVFWNLVSMPVAFLVVPTAAKQKGAGAWIALVFPVIGIILLIRAIRQTIAFIEFGKPCFEMASVPGVVGRELKGTIQARFPHSPDHGVHLRISCVHRVTSGSGNSQSTSESILWRDEADLDSAQLCPGPIGTTIPVAFHIPLDAHSTEKVNARDEYVWVLEAFAEVPGVDYHDIFEVPVFRTSKTPTAAEAAEQDASFASSVPAPSRPDQLTIEVQQTVEGTEFYFRPARNRSFAASSTLFMMVFGAVTFFLVHHAPFIFPLFFGLFFLVLVYITLQLWLGTTRIVIGQDLKLQSGYLGGGKIQQVAFADIASISDSIRSQQGGATGTPYYDIEATLQSGKKLTLGRAVRSKREAEWLVSEMGRLTGLQTRAAGASASG